MDAYIFTRIFDAVGAIHSTRYAHLASGTIIIYDHLITFGDELDLIWTGSWSLGKALFILNRYYFLFAALFNNYGLLSAPPSDSFCLRFFQWQGWTGWFACVLAEVILQMRIYALYFLDKKVLLLMVTCFLLTSATSATILGVVLSRIDVTSHVPLTDARFCFAPSVPDYFFTFWIPILVFESLIFVLAVVRGFQTFKTNGGLFQSGRYLVKILIRDSIMYFLIMFVTYLTNLLVWVAGPADLFEIPIGFTVALSCVLGNRVILNVRQANRDHETSLAQTSPRQDSSWSPSSNLVLPSAGGLTDGEMIRLRTLRAGSHGRFVVV